MVARTGYSTHWLGDYTSNVEVLGALAFAFVDNSGGGSGRASGEALHRSAFSADAVSPVRGLSDAAQRCRIEVLRSPR